MGKILIICGIIIIITPKLFKSSYYQNENKYNLFLKVTGVFVILLGGLYCFGKNRKRKFSMYHTVWTFICMEPWVIMAQNKAGMGNTFKGNVCC